MKYDIVYILKNDINDEELIYSVRSVVANFPYKKIWFVGGTPKHIKPDKQLSFQQKGSNKWQKVRNSLQLIANNHEISKDFWLFNDDFFIMQPIKNTELIPVTNGTLNNLIRQRVQADKRMSNYAVQLFNTKQALLDKNMDILNYAIHIPILLNKEKVIQTLQTFEDTTLFRSLYGNQHHILGMNSNDVKISKSDQKPTGKEIFLSTSDESFKNGLVGEYIKNKFPDKCKYEL